MPVDERERGEIDALGRAFNRMTSQLDHQRTALIDANRELEERRRFTEAVLAGVAVGVVGLDAERRVHLPNRVASDLLGVDLTGHLDRPLAEIVPEFGTALEDASRRPDRTVEIEVEIERERELRTFQVRARAETSPGGTGGFVLTFADITGLAGCAADSRVVRCSAPHRPRDQESAHAHPACRGASRPALCPPDRGRPRDLLAMCIDTIVRQVDDMRRMVNEFASFARMPAPVLAEADLGDVVRRAVFLQTGAAQGIEIETSLPERPVMQVCDPQLLGQAITNLLLNAAQALEDRGGRITVALAELPESAEITVEDNGPGFPPDLRHRLTEPYVTSKGRRGAGLGLAIVQKIVEDQGAALHLEDGEAGGARVRIVFGHGETVMEPERGRLHNA